MLNLFINNQIIMKTNQLILAAALVVLAGCNKVNVETFDETNEIGFRAVASMATKANDAIISGTTYATENTFQVWGWQSENGLFTDAVLVDNYASNFMSNLTISYCGGPQSRADAWRNADHYYYWPFTGAISFLAVHPSTVAPTSTGWDATNKKPKATFADYTIVPGTNETVDLMLADNWGTRRADALPMVFKHALSQIVVIVKTNEDYTNDVKFDVNSVQFNKIDLSGDLAYANTAFDWSDNAAQTQDWMYYNTIHENVNATPAIYGAAKVMIPQNANPDDTATTDVIEGTTLTINYTMTQTGSAAITGTVVVPAPWNKVKEGSTDYDPAVAFPGWEPGKKYNYTLNFKLNEITFAPEVTDWVEVDVQTINILD